VLESWLKSGVASLTALSATDMGVHQGGVISPALCNITLNGLEPHVAHATINMLPKRQRTKVYLVRYADDFVATAANQDILAKVKRSLEEFLAPGRLDCNCTQPKLGHGCTIKTILSFWGLSFPNTLWILGKTCIARRNKSQMRRIFRPSRANIAELKAKVRQVLKSGMPIGDIIKDLNPTLRRWAYYFSVARHSQRAFKTLGNMTWFRMLRWAQAKHTNRNIA
jgi:RNA-directed DNA polymerase